MPTPTQAALIRQLARVLAEASKAVTPHSSLAAIEAEAAAQAALAAKAAEFGIPLAEATAEYGLAGSTALVPGAAAPAVAPAAAAPTGGVVLRVVTAVGRVAGGGAATGTVIVVTAAGVLAWGPSHLAGVAAADKPIAPGSRTHEGGANVAPFVPKPNSPGDQYYIYAVNTSGWSCYIGRPSDVEGRAGKSLPDGGTGDQPIEYKKLVDKPFNSASEATAYLKARVSPGKQSVWTGTWLKFEGGEYRTVHVGL